MGKLTCREFVEESSALVDPGGPPPKPPLREHFACCSCCATYIDQLRSVASLAAKLRELPEFHVPPGAPLRAFQRWRGG